MPLYTLPVLGIEISFRTEADAQRVYDAKEYVEKLFEGLNKSGLNASKEMLLSVLALSMADDYLQMKNRLEEIESKVGALIGRLD